MTCQDSETLRGGSKGNPDTYSSSDLVSLSSLRSGQALSELRNRPQIPIADSPLFFPRPKGCHHRRRT